MTSIMSPARYGQCCGEGHDYCICTNHSIVVIFVVVVVLIVVAKKWKQNNKLLLVLFQEHIRHINSENIIRIKKNKIEGFSYKISD